MACCCSRQRESPWPRPWVAACRRRGPRPSFLEYLEGGKEEIDEFVHVTPVADEEASGIDLSYAPGEVSAAGDGTVELCEGFTSDTATDVEGVDEDDCVVLMGRGYGAGGGAGLGASWGVRWRLLKMISVHEN